MQLAAIHKDFALEEKQRQDRRRSHGRDSKDAPQMRMYKYRDYMDGPEIFEHRCHNIHLHISKPSLDKASTARCFSCLGTKLHISGTDTCHILFIYNYLYNDNEWLADWPTDSCLLSAVRRRQQDMRFELDLGSYMALTDRVRARLAGCVLSVLCV